MIKAKGLIRHDGQVFRSGDSFAADGDTERRLVSMGVAEPVSAYAVGVEMGAMPEGAPAHVEVCGDDIDLPPEEDEPSREDLEEEYRALGGQPRSDWSLDKLLSKIEERRS